MVYRRRPIWRGDWLIGSVFVISEKSVRFSMPLRQVFPVIVILVWAFRDGWFSTGCHETDGSHSPGRGSGVPAEAGTCRWAAPDLRNRSCMN